MLSTNLKKKNIIINPQISDKWELIDSIVQLAVKSKEITPEQSAGIKSILTEREKSMSTGIGNGVAIPHCASDKISKIIYMLALCPDGIDFTAIDEKPAKIIVLLIVPKNKLTQHVKTLANIARLLSNSQLRKDLLARKTPDSVIKILKKYEDLKLKQ